MRSTLIVERVPECKFQNTECVCLKVRVKGNDFYFGAVYRRPNAGNEFWGTLDLSIQKVKENVFPEFFLVGDLNSNSLNQNSNIHYFINSSNLTQVIDQPTREPSNALLDVILTNSPARINYYGVLDPICSDHKPVYVYLNLKSIKSKVSKRVIWDFKNANFE